MFLLLYKEEITGLINHITSLTNELASLECKRECTDTSDQSSSNIQSPMNANNINHDGEYSNIDVVKSFIAEEKVKAKCHLNKIIHQVPKSIATEGPIRKQEDVQQVTSIFEKYVGVNPNIQNIFRLCSNGKKLCLLKIVLPSEHNKAIVLRNSSKLHKDENSDKIKTIFVTPDLTPKELEKNKKLRAELKEK